MILIESFSFHFFFCEGKCYNWKVIFFLKKNLFYNSSDEVNILNVPENKLTGQLIVCKVLLLQFTMIQKLQEEMISFKDPGLRFQVNTNLSIAFSEGRIKPRFLRCLSRVSKLVVDLLVNILIQFSRLYSLSHVHRHIHMCRKSCLRVLSGAFYAPIISAVSW